MHNFTIKYIVLVFYNNSIQPVYHLLLYTVILLYLVNCFCKSINRDIIQSRLMSVGFYPTAYFTSHR